MIKKPKNVLFKETILLSICLGVCLIGLFISAQSFSPRYFLFLSYIISGTIVFLVIFKVYLLKKQALIQLQLEDVYERINMTDVSIAKDHKVISSFHQKIEKYDRLKNMTEKLSACFTLDDTSQVLSKEVSKLYGDEDKTVIFYLFHSETGELGISSSHKGQMHVNIKSKKGDEFDQYLVKTMQPLLVEDSKSDYRFDMDKLKKEDDRSIQSLISIPMMVGSRALGIIRVDSQKPDDFSTEDLRFLTTIGDLGALAIENAQLYEHVQQLAIKDSLTGLFLRRYLEKRLKEEITRQQRAGHALTILMIDIDYFKKYNDTFGHIAGDIVLKAVGQTLTDHFSGPGQFSARYGGEEFAVILPDCSLFEAQDKAEKFRSAIEQMDIMLRREPTRVTVSIGVASLGKNIRDSVELIRQADEALYRAKDKGRNRIEAG